MESGKPFTIIRDAAKSNSYFHVISDKKYSDTKEKTPQNMLDTQTDCPDYFIGPNKILTVRSAGPTVIHHDCY